MKLVFTQNGVVTGIASSAAAGVTVSSGGGTVDYQVDDSTPVDVGWSVVLANGLPGFTAPKVSAALPMLTPMTLYMAFTPAERIAIKASADPFVVEFWAMFQLSVQLQKPTDPNLVSVQEALGYLATPAKPGPGGGILSSQARVQQILAGVPQ